MTEAARLPSGVVPRLLTRDQAAAYCGISEDQFRRHIASQIAAIEIGAQLRWDVKALDRWLDRFNSPAHPSLSKERALGALNGDQDEGR